MNGGQKWNMLPGKVTESLHFHCLCLVIISGRSEAHYEADEVALVYNSLCFLHGDDPHNECWHYPVDSAATVCD